MDSAFGDSRFGMTTQPLMLGFGRSGTHGRQHSVPRHIGLIEPWIGGALAAYTAWLFAVAYREHVLLWAYVAGAALLALWSWRRPARHQRELMVRAVLFALMGLAMTWDHRGGITAPESSFFFWVSVPGVFYAFLLRTSFAWFLLGLNLAVTVGALLSSPGEVQLAPMVARAGFLVMFAGAAIRMGAVLRRTDELLEERRVDAASGMLNEYGLVDYGAEHWMDCRRSGVPVTLVFMDVPDLAGLRGLYGARIARLAVEKTLHLMESLAGGRNLVGRLGPARFALLVPGATREQALHFLGDRLGHPPQIELDEDDLELIFLVNLHAAESRMQNVSFLRFFEAERDMLDFYFTGPRDGQPDTDDASLAGAAQPVRAPAVVGLPAFAVAAPRDPAPSTLPMGPV